MLQFAPSAYPLPHNIHLNILVTKSQFTRCHFHANRATFPFLIVLSSCKLSASATDPVARKAVLCECASRVRVSGEGEGEK